jgi:hypothetical protein
MVIIALVTEKPLPRQAFFLHIAQLPPDVVKGCISGADGAVWPFRLALSEHGAACINEHMPKFNDVNAGNGRLPCHKAGDRGKDGGYAVVGGVWKHGGGAPCWLCRAGYQGGMNSLSILEALRAGSGPAVSIS